MLRVAGNAEGGRFTARAQASAYLRCRRSQDLNALNSSARCKATALVRRGQNDGELFAA